MPFLCLMMPVNVLVAEGELQPVKRECGDVVRLLGVITLKDLLSLVTKYLIRIPGGKVWKVEKHRRETARYSTNIKETQTTDILIRVLSYPALKIESRLGLIVMVEGIEVGAQLLDERNN